MKTNNTKYIVFDIKKDSELTELYFIRLNENYRIIDRFEYSLKNDLDKKKFFQKFKKWIGNLYDYKYVTYEKQRLNTMIEEFSNIEDKLNPIRAFKNQFIELKKEINSNLKEIDYITPKSILGSYGMNFLGDDKSIKDCCYNYVSIFAYDMLTKERLLKEEKQREKEKLKAKNKDNDFNFRNKRYFK